MTIFAMMYIFTLLPTDSNCFITLIFKSIKKEVSLGYSRDFFSLLLFPLVFSLDPFRVLL